MVFKPGTEPEPVPRLTMRSLLQGFLTRFFSLERGWLRTARELTVAPGDIIRRYVEGQRKDYANPFAYLVAATFVSFLAQTLVNFRQRMIDGMELTAGESPTQVAFIRMITELLFSNMLWLAILIFVPLALLLRLFFLRSGRNLAEVFVFALYSGGHLAVLGTVLIAGTLFFRPGGPVHSIIGIVLAIAYTSWASHGFFRGGVVIRTIKVGSAWLISYALVVVFGMIGAITWILATGQVTGEDWDLVSAAELDMAPVVTRLLQDGADPDMTRDRTALHVAVETDNCEIVNLLLEAGADIDARDHLGRTPLFLAVVRKREDISRTLLEAGADASATTNLGTSLLSIAAGRGDQEVFSWALAHGADVNALRSEGPYTTALMVAAALGKGKMVQQLLKEGADPSITNSEGQTALDLATSEEVKALLQSASESDETE